MPYPDPSDDAACHLFDVRRGHADQRWLRAGTTLVAHEGIFHVAESAFHLDGAAFQARHCLREGDAFEVGQTGWVVMSSDQGGRVVCVTRPSVLRRAAQAVTAWLRQWATGSVKPL
jgi:hypothetical protein